MSHIMSIYDGVEALEINFTTIIQKRTSQFVVVLAVKTVMQVEIIILSLCYGIIDVCIRNGQPSHNIGIDFFS